MTANDLVGLLPVAVFAAGATAIGVLERRVRADPRTWTSFAAIVSVGAFAAASLGGSGPDAIGGLVRRDLASAFITSLVGLASTCLFVVALGRRTDAPPRAIAAALVAAAGAILASAAGDLVVMAIGIALVAAPVIVANSRGARRARVLRGLAPAAFVALGGALAFADVGSTRIGAIGAVSSPPGLGGAALVVAGLAMVASLVPFQGWLAPSGLVGGIAGFASLLRIAGAISATGALSPDWRASIAILAALTIVVATFAAIGAPSVTRVLGHLAVAQWGYAASALAAGVAAGSAIAFALASSAVLAIGGAATLDALGGEADLRRLHGVARRRPYLVAAIAIVLLGSAGVPPTAGFIARVYVFEIAIGAQLAWLVILGSLASVVATVAALRVVFACLGEAEAPPLGSRYSRVAVVVVAVLVLLVGIIPGPLLDAVGNVSF